MSRVLGLDYGERRIGLAVSDPTGTIAQALTTVRRRRGKRPPYAAIIEIMRQWEVDRIVVGLPIEASGEEGEAARQVRDFAEGLHRRTDTPLEFWDERFSSARARRYLSKSELSARARREKGRVDTVAAALILQSYLDAQRNA